MEQAFTHAAEWDGPIVVHVLTQKGRGYAPAEEDDVQRLHDVKATKAVALENTVGNSAGRGVGGSATTDGGGVASRSRHPTASVEPSRNGPAPTPTPSPGPSWRRPKRTRALWRSRRPCPGRRDCWPSRPAFPTASSTSASPSSTGPRRPPAWPWPGLRPVVAVYSTFWSRAFDQANLDVGLHGCPVVFVLDRAGITGDDGPSHHGILDLALALSIPGMTVFAPSSAEEVEPMLRTALDAARARPPSGCPRRRRGTWTRRGGQRARRRASSAPATGRSACSAWGRWSRPA